MPITVTKVANGRDLDAFIRVPFDIFRGDQNWVPPLEMDLRGRLDKKANPFFEHGDGDLFVAREGENVVGRITAQIDRSHVERHGEKVGFFGFFDAPDRPDVAKALLEAAEAWNREKGMEKIRGPYSLNIWEELGMLVEGFDTPPMIMMPHNLPYYGALVEGAGYVKAKDFFAWRYTVGDVTGRARRGADEARQLPEVKIRPVDMGNFAREIRIVMDIFNDAWSENYGFVPLTEAELVKTAKDLKMLVDPEICIMLEIDGEPAAFAIAIPNVNEIIGDLGGKLFPFGLVKLLWRLKVRRTKTARLMLLGIRKKYRHVKKYGGLSFLLYTEMNDRGKKRGYEWGELSWTVEDNHPVNLGIKAMGGRVYKTYRVYEKTL
jgi:hypothetical protein